MGINELKQLQIIGIAQLQQKNVGGICSKLYPYCSEIAYRWPYRPLAGYGLPPPPGGIL